MAGGNGFLMKKPWLECLWFRLWLDKNKVWIELWMDLEGLVKI